MASVIVEVTALFSLIAIAYCTGSSVVELLYCAQVVGDDGWGESHDVPLLDLQHSIGHVVFVGSA